MRRRNPHPKRREETLIPETLRESLREAAEIVREAESDSDINIDFDDAIQTSALRGGRCGKGMRPFRFTYSHKSNGKKSKWFLEFHSFEIEDIADGRMTAMWLHCCQTETCGHKSSNPNDLCACDWMEDPHFGNIEFPAATETLRNLGIKKITSDSTMQEVIDILGQPTAAGAGGDREHSTLGYVHPWIKYHRTDCQLRFEFNKGQGCRMISVMEPNWQAGK